MNTENFLYVEKYRPQTIEDTILPANIKKSFQEFVSNGEIPNLLLSGSAGVGKTTIAKAVCNELGADYIVINGSDEGRLIDTLRTKIKNFASTSSLEGGRKYLILDEADYLNPQSTQPALRGFMEEFHKNCGFILTCNYENRLIPPLHSRCSVVNFKIPNQEKPKLASKLFERSVHILKEQNVDYEDKVLVELIKKHFPDFRKLINELQRYSVSGTIDAGILVNVSDENLKTLVTHLKGKEFSDMRKWVVQNLDKDPSSLFSSIYEILYKHLQPQSINAIHLVSSII